MAAITMFVCKRIGGARLTRSSCGSRYELINGERERPRGEIKIEDRQCVGCPIGKLHAAGDRPTAWPDGGAIQLVDQEVSGPVAPPAPRAPKVVKPEIKGPAPLLDDRRPDPVAALGESPRDALAPAKIEHDPELAAFAAPGKVYPPKMNDFVVVDGVRRTAAEWARHLGISFAAIYTRVTKGWTVEEAVSTPKGQRPARMGERVDRALSREKGTLASQVVEVDGVSRTVDEWCLVHRMVINNVRTRMRCGWTLAEAVSIPLGQSNPRIGLRRLEEAASAPVAPEPPPAPVEPVAGLEDARDEDGRLLCPDSASCFHGCDASTDCWRRSHGCEPLSISGLGPDWKPLPPGVPYPGEEPKKKSEPEMSYRERFPPIMIIPDQPALNLPSPSKEPVREHVMHPPVPADAMAKVLEWMRTAALTKPVELLRSLGYDAVKVGDAPDGQVILVRPGRPSVEGAASSPG